MGYIRYIDRLILTECTYAKDSVSGLRFQVCIVGEGTVPGLLLTECTFTKDSVSGILWTAPNRTYIWEGQRLRTALSIP